MAVGPHEAQLIGPLADLLKEPLNALVADAELGGLVARRNVWVDLRGVARRSQLESKQESLGLLQLVSYLAAEHPSPPLVALGSGSPEIILLHEPEILRILLTGCLRNSTESPESAPSAMRPRNSLRSPTT